VDQSGREEIAAALLGAYASGNPIDPPAAAHAGLTADDAYEIRQRLVRRAVPGSAPGRP
jgi:2-keto-4-pentenoate hydratase